MLVRSWNLFHGNAVPPERDAFLREAVELAASGDPDVVCLQEVPAWALGRLGGWSGMTAVPVLAQPPRLGPLPSTAAIGKALTDLNHGLLRSAFTGQGNAILVAPRLRVLGEERIVLNARRFRDERSQALGLGALPRLAWAKERRVCQAVRLALPDGGTATVANLHATSHDDRRLAQAEIVRAAVFTESVAAPGELCVLAGDFNAEGRLPVFEELARWGFTGRGEGIDHVLVRDGTATAPAAWPEERRRIGGRLLSDHAPVEVTIE